MALCGSLAHAGLGRVWVAKEAAQVRGLVWVGGFGWTVAKRDQSSVPDAVHAAGAVCVEELTGVGRCYVTARKERPRSVTGAAPRRNESGLDWWRRGARGSRDRMLRHPRRGGQYAMQPFESSTQKYIPYDIHCIVL